MQEANLNPKDGIILAHTWNAAKRACGLTSSDAPGTSNVETIARVVSSFWSTTATNRTREKSIREIERIILDMMGKIDDNEHPSCAAKRNGFDTRWLRRISYDFLTHLPKICSNTDEERTRWLSTLHYETKRLNIDFPKGKSVKGYFRKPQKSEWAKPLQCSNTKSIIYSTIHEAKGKEFEAVCVVIPPDRAPDNRTSHLFDVWENRTDDEAKRVVYVGVTRAKKLITVVIHENFKERLFDLLNKNYIKYEKHILY